MRAGAFKLLDGPREAVVVEGRDTEEDGAVRAGAFRLLDGPDVLVVLEAFEEEPFASAGGNEGSPLGPRS